MTNKPRLWPSHEPIPSLADVFSPAASPWCGGTISDNYGFTKIQLPFQPDNAGISHPSDVFEHLRTHDAQECQRIEGAIAEAEASHVELTGKRISWILLPPLTRDDDEFADDDQIRPLNGNAAATPPSPERRRSELTYEGKKPLERVLDDGGVGGLPAHW